MGQRMKSGGDVCEGVRCERYLAWLEVLGVAIVDCVVGQYAEFQLAYTYYLPSADGLMRLTDWGLG